VLCPRSDPLNKALHLILPQIVRESYRQNYLKQDVFTQPGSEANVRSSAGVDLQSQVVLTLLTLRNDLPEKYADEYNMRSVRAL
jgi:hypothetical protein